MKKRSKKKSLSSIIATVLLILLVILSVGIIWKIIFPLFSSLIQNSNLELTLSQETLTISDAVVYSTPSGDRLNMTIKRGPTNLVNVVTNYSNTETTTTTVIPADIVLVIDLSQSMYTFENNIARINRVKNVSKIFMQNVLNLNNQSNIGLVGFQGASTGPPHIYIVPLSQNYTNLSKQIDSWTVNDGTYLCTGLDTGRQVIHNQSLSAKKIIVLLGDGDATDDCGNHNETKIANLSASQGINLDTIAFGTDAGAAFFINISNAGNGTFYNSTDVNNLSQSFAAILQTMNQTVTQTQRFVLQGTYLKFLIYAGGDSYSYIIRDNLPGSHETQSYSIPLKDGWSAGNITKIEVYLGSNENGADVLSRLMSTYEF